MAEHYIVQGWMCPKILSAGQSSAKSDVYSFGVGRPLPLAANLLVPCCRHLLTRSCAVCWEIATGETPILGRIRELCALCCCLLLSAGQALTITQQRVQDRGGLPCRHHPADRRLHGHRAGEPPFCS